MVNKEITRIEGDVSIKASADPTIYGEGNLDISGDLTVTGNVSFATSTISHNGLTNLTADDHIQYALLAGRNGGQIITGGTASGNNTTIRSTSNATKGSIIFDETTASSSSITGAVRVAGGLGISNTTDAVSSTNGGTITTAGGLAVAKKAFIGTDLVVGGNLTVTGTASLPHNGLTGLSADDHSQYALLAGRSGGQIITGGTASGNNTTIRSTSNATKGSVVFDETTASSSSITGAVRVAGGLGISNTTDAVSATNGGTITTAGGLAVAKKAFIGSDLAVGGNNTVGGNLTVTGALAFGSSVISHSGLTNLAADDHVQYTLLAGRTGGQIITGGTASGNNTTIRSTSNATKGSVVFDETTASSSSITGAVRVAGGLGISNTTDAVSSTNGGTITTAGGLAVAKKAFIGTDLAVGGNLTVTGTASLPHNGLTGLSADDHSQYALLAGRTGGQIITGGIASGNNTTIRSTSNATKGSVVFDETTPSSSSTSGSILVSGGLAISNTTDAVSATNGGTITTAGGLAVAKKAFIGTDLAVGGNSATTGNSTVGGNLTVAGALTFGSSVISHSGLTNLTADDHVQYTLLAGRSGGQIITGGTASGNNTTIRSTSNATKGSVLFDETTASSSSITGAVRVAGGLGISNTTDAVSATNGGTITTAGGLAVAKKAFIGTDLAVGGNLTVTGALAFGSSVISHSGLTNLTADDHVQYTLLAGRSGGQIITGGTASGNNTTIRSTSNVTKGSVVFDETTPTSSSTSGSILVSGGLGISNATDATSATNGGTITTAGGLAVAKKAFIGTDLAVGGNLTVTGTASLPHNGLTGLSADDHVQYALLAGRTGGQIITGGTASGNNTTIRSTSNATKGSVLFDETVASSSSTSGSVLVSGGLGISNTTDAVSVTNGGTITTAGGLAVAKKAFIGTDLAVGGKLVVTGTATVPAPNPSNNGEVVNIGYLNSVSSAAVLPPRLYDGLALVTDLSAPMETKWKGSDIYNLNVDTEKTKHLRIAKIGSQIINLSTVINFGNRVNLDSSHYEQNYSRTAYLIKVPGIYYISGNLTAGIDTFTNSSTIEWSVQTADPIVGSFTTRQGSRSYTAHSTSTILGTGACLLSCCLIVPSGGLLFRIVASRVSGTSTISCRIGSNISVIQANDSQYLDAYSTVFSTLNNSTYTDLPLSTEYYSDPIFNFTVPGPTLGVTTTGTYFVSVQVTFQRPSITGTNPIGIFRLVDESGASIVDTISGTTYNNFNGAITGSNATASWAGLINLTESTGTIKIQALISSGTGALNASASIVVSSINTSTFPSQTNFRTVSTSNQLLSTTVFNIPWQSTIINIGGTSFTPGNTSITVVKSGLYKICGSIPILVPLVQTNILITVSVIISYDGGFTFRNVGNASLVKLAANNMSIPFCYNLSLYPGARVRVTVNSSGTVADLITLGNNASLSILSFDNLTEPVDLFPINRSFYKFCENLEFYAIPSTSPTLISSIWSKYVPEGLYRISFSTIFGLSIATTIVTFVLNQAAQNRDESTVFSRGATYSATGDYPLIYNRIVKFEKGITHLFLNIVCNRANAITITTSLLEIERVI